jgi:hypothetical protein
MARFDAKRVNPLEWAGMAAGVAALIALRVPWFNPSGWEVEFAAKRGFEAAPVGWEVGVLARTAMLLLVAGAFAVLLPHLGIRVPWRSVIWIGGALVAAVLVPISRNNYGRDGFYRDVSIWFHLTVGAAWVSLLAAALNARLAPRPA